MVFYPEPSHRAADRAVQTGRPAVEVLEPKGAWAYLQDRPREAEIFGRAMMAKASADLGAVAAAQPVVIGFGGGRSAWLGLAEHHVVQPRGWIFRSPRPSPAAVLASHSPSRWPAAVSNRNGSRCTESTVRSFSEPPCPAITASSAARNGDALSPASVTLAAVVCGGWFRPGFRSEPILLSGGRIVVTEQQDQIGLDIGGQRRPGGDVAADPGFEPGGFQRDASFGDLVGVGASGDEAAESAAMVELELLPR
jgi:hypothetical protein